MGSDPVFGLQKAWEASCMPRPLRIELAVAIYRLMARGTARQKIFQDYADYERLREGLGRTVERCGWELLTFVFMPHHLHLFLRTPQPNLSRGMQYLLSGYANCFRQRPVYTGFDFNATFL